MDDNNPKLSLSDRFSRAAQWTSQQCGHAYSFVGAIIIIAAWAASGPALLHQTQFVAEPEERQTL
jgi:low affinity Fe/Cu permease